MVNEKNSKRVGIEDELTHQGIRYEPLVAGHFGGLHPSFDDFLTHLAKACSRRKGWRSTAVERQIRGRLGAALARRAARMSLATWGRRDDSGGVILPTVEYDDIDRTTATDGDGSHRDEHDSDGTTTEGSGVGNGKGKGDRSRRGVTENEPAPPWDPGPMVGWGTAHSCRLHVHAGDRTGTYMRGAGDGPHDRTTYQ